MNKTNFMGFLEKQFKQGKVEVNDLVETNPEFKKVMNRPKPVNNADSIKKIANKYGYADINNLDMFAPKQKTIKDVVFKVMTEANETDESKNGSVKINFDPIVTSQYHSKFKMNRNGVDITVEVFYPNSYNTVTCRLTSGDLEPIVFEIDDKSDDYKFNFGRIIIEKSNELLNAKKQAEYSTDVTGAYDEPSNVNVKVSGLPLKLEANNIKMQKLLALIEADDNEVDPMDANADSGNAPGVDESGADDVGGAMDAMDSFDKGDFSIGGGAGGAGAMGGGGGGLGGGGGMSPSDVNDDGTSNGNPNAEVYTLKQIEQIPNGVELQQGMESMIKQMLLRMANKDNVKIPLTAGMLDGSDKGGILSMYGFDRNTGYGLIPLFVRVLTAYQTNNTLENVGNVTKDDLGPVFNELALSPDQWTQFVSNLNQDPDTFSNYLSTLFQESGFDNDVNAVLKTGEEMSPEYKPQGFGSDEMPEDDGFGGSFMGDEGIEASEDGFDDNIFNDIMSTTPEEEEDMAGDTKTPLPNI